LFHVKQFLRRIHVLILHGFLAPFGAKCAPARRRNGGFRRGFSRIDD